MFRQKHQSRNVLRRRETWYIMSELKKPEKTSYCHSERSEESQEGASFFSNTESGQSPAKRVWPEEEGSEFLLTTSGCSAAVLRAVAERIEAYGSCMPTKSAVARIAPGKVKQGGRPQITKYITGCGAAGSAGGLGPPGRRFEPCHSDQKGALIMIDQGPFDSSQIVRCLL